MELRQLKYFVQIVEHGSLTRAAKSLYIAQPALSQQMAALETDLGVKLLTRSTRGVTATEAGLAFYKQANLILKQLQAARDVVKDAAGHPTGHVSIGLATSTAIVLTVPFMVRAFKTLPEIRIEIHESSSSYLNELVINGRLDIGILFLSQPSKGLRIKTFLTESLYLVAAPAKKKEDATVSLLELSKYPLLMSSKPNTVRVRVEEAFEQSQLTFKTHAEINSTTALKSMAEAGLGHTVLPWSAIAEEVNSGRLNARKIVKPEIFRAASLCVSDSMPLSFAAQCVSELLLETIYELVSNGRWSGVRLNDVTSSEVLQ